MKIKKESFEIYVRTAVLTFVILVCTATLYLGICSSYEQMRKVCFSDERSAVIISEEYIKFFDYELFF